MPRASTPQAAAAAIRSVLHARRWRTEIRTEGSDAVAVSAEKGYLRETGNLIFHVALVLHLVGLGLGALWGWKGGVLISEGNTFCDTVQSYDQFTQGGRMNETSLPPFCVTLDRRDSRAAHATWAYSRMTPPEPVGSLDSGSRLVVEQHWFGTFPRSCRGRRSRWPADLRPDAQEGPPRGVGVAWCRPILAWRRIRRIVVAPI